MKKANAMKTLPLAAMAMLLTAPAYAAVPGITGTTFNLTAQQAYQQALAIKTDLVDEGRPVPPAVVAAYQVGLSGYHLRELRELKRQREERWLAVMLEVERSHIPFPDEPPVEFPSPAIIRKITGYNRGWKGYRDWKEFSDYRIKRYGVLTFGDDVPGHGRAGCLIECTAKRTTDRRPRR